MDYTVPSFTLVPRTTNVLGTSVKWRRRDILWCLDGVRATVHINVNVDDDFKRTNELTASLHFTLTPNSSPLVL